MFDKFKALILALVTSITYITTLLLPESASQIPPQDPTPPDQIIKICDENISIAEDVAQHSKDESAVRYARALIEETKTRKQKAIAMMNEASNNN